MNRVFLYSVRLGAVLGASAALLPVLASAACQAQTTSETTRNDSAAAQSREETAEQLRELEEVVTNLARQHVPREYENNKKWGLTKEVVSGLSIRRDGLQIKTKRRRKQVNDGAWKSYRAELVNPDEELTIRLANVDTSGAGPLEFDLEATARLRVFGRIAQWERGVQLFSVSADAAATVRLRTRVRVALRLDPTKFPPDFLLRPEVTRADIELVDFRLYRLSDVGGPLAKHLGEGLRELLEEAIEEERGELPAKINRQIAKKQDKLRLSLHDAAASQWARLSAQSRDMESTDESAPPRP